MSKTYTLFLLFFFCIQLSLAQKPPLNHEVYDDWQSIGHALISKKGNWVGYSVLPQQGDAELRIVRADKSREISIPRGKNLVFTPDEQWFIAQISPLFAETRAARIKKKKPEEMPADSLIISSLASGSPAFKAAEVSSFKTGKKRMEYVAYLKKQSPDTTKNSAKTDSSSKKEKPAGTLFIRHLVSGTETKIPGVKEYAFNPEATRLFYVREFPASLADSTGLYLYDLRQQKASAISLGTGEYKNIAFDESGEQLAFTAYKGPAKKQQKNYHLFFYQTGADSARRLGKADDLPENWAVSPHGKVEFSKDGKKLFFGSAPVLPLKDTALVDFETATLDIWHWQDDYLQPQQLVNLKRDQQANYLSVVFPQQQNPKLIPLGSPQIPIIRTDTDKDSDYVLGLSDWGNRIQTQWKTGAYQDLWLISMRDGSRRRIASELRGPVSLSPKGNYVVWFDRDAQHWFSYSVQSGETLNLTQNLQVSFANEDHDMPDTPSGYGIAGWDPDEKTVFINDKFDVWALNVSGKQATKLTQGRENKITYRFLELGRDPELPAASPEIDLKKNLYFSQFNHRDKKHGFALLEPRGRGMESLLLEPFTFRQVRASENLTTLVYTKENYQSSPDLYISKMFKQEEAISRINAQQQHYRWGTAELIQWTTPAGNRAEGILYKPENFDPEKKYPMIAYFYERLSDGLYSYIPPTPTPSRLNISYFVSNGYLVFAPDIHYETGYPGKAAEEYVNSGVEYLKTKAFVDELAIGIQGQSWGGYQVAHLITRSNLYAAAWAGAPVVNMTSAYGGIRWQSGMSRQFQYENTQSRIGQTLWENLDLYIENSPLFHLPKVNTPVVIMANDADGAVPWYQGIEMFTALRRLGKPSWLLNYNGDAHNLVKRPNKKDIQIREQQFFDHYLKGLPAPVWLKSGVPATLKGIDWGLELTED